MLKIINKNILDHCGVVLWITTLALLMFMPSTKVFNNLFYVSITVTLLLSFCKISSYKTLIKSPSSYLLLVTLLYFLLSTLWGPEAKGAHVKYIVYLFLFFLSIYNLNLKHSISTLTRFSLPIAALGALYCIFFQTDVVGRPFALGSDLRWVNRFSALIVFWCVASFHHFIVAKSLVQKVTFILCWLVFSAGVWLSMSRAALLDSICGVVMYVILDCYFKRKFTKVHLAGLILLLFINVSLSFICPRSQFSCARVNDSFVAVKPKLVTPNVDKTKSVLISSWKIVAVDWHGAHTELFKLTNKSMSDTFLDNEELTIPENTASIFSIVQVEPFDKKLVKLFELRFVDNSGDVSTCNFGNAYDQNRLMSMGLYDIRGKIWAEVISRGMSHWICGHGANSKVENLFIDNFRIEHAHNIFVGMFYRTGVVGLLLLCGLILVSYARAFYYKSTILLVLITTGLLASCVEIPTMITRPSSCWIFFLLPMFLALTTHAEEVS